MRTTNLNDWRSGASSREQCRQLEESLEVVFRENEALKEALQAECGEMEEELKEKLDEKYGDEIISLRHELAKKDDRIAELEEETQELSQEIDKLHHDFDTRIATIRDLLGATVNHIDGDYIENQIYGKKSRV